MGWKAFAIIISPNKGIDKEGLLKKIGFNNLKKTDDELVEVAINPDENKVYIGTYKDNLIITAPDLPMTFFEDRITDVEKMLINVFPDSEICAIVLHSVGNIWGYSVIKNGNKIRARAGSAEDGTFFEIGAPLEEELELLQKSTIDENGNRTYIFEEFPDEPLTEDQVGESFVFEICSRYFGTQLDRADDLLFETVLSGYEYLNSETSNSTSVKPKQWWKFW